MANKRTLKHAINAICEELFAECMAASLYGAENHKDDAEALLFSILKTQSDFVARVSHPEPGLTPESLLQRLAREVLGTDQRARGPGERAIIYKYVEEIL